MKKILYNAIVFNIAWFVCILGGSLYAVPFAFVVIGIHLAFFSNNKTEIALIVVVLLFATTLNHSLRWFQSHLPVALIMGAVSAPLTYLGGTRLNDFSMREPLILTLVSMGVVWCVVFPFCLILARHLLSERPGQ